MINFTHKIFGLAKSSDLGMDYIYITVQDMRSQRTFTFKKPFHKDLSVEKILRFTSNHFKCDINKIFIMPHIDFEIVGVKS